MADNPIKFQKKNTEKPIPQQRDWLCDIRITTRIALETVKGIIRTGWINIAIITTIAAILTIFGALFRTTLSMTEFVKQVGSALEISVYLKPDVAPESISTRIKELENVQKVTIITKDEAWKKMREQIDVADMQNPLPDTLRVKVDVPEHINTVFEKIKAIPGVDDLNYAKDVAEKMETFNAVVNSMTVLVVIFVAILTIAIINNTIQLVIQNKKEEIEIMRLMGVTNSYIRIPLILQGAIYGFLGAFIAMFPMGAIENKLIWAHEFVNIPVPPLAKNIVLFSLFVIGISFSAGGSLLSIKKHLKV